MHMIFPLTIHLQVYEEKEKIVMSCRNVQDNIVLPITEAIATEKLLPFAIVIICQVYDFDKWINLVVLLHGQQTWDFLN